MILKSYHTIEKSLLNRFSVLRKLLGSKNLFNWNHRDSSIPSPIPCSTVLLNSDTAGFRLSFRQAITALSASSSTATNLK